MSHSETGRRQILRLAWPIVLANSAVPILGLVDTAVIGNTGTVVELGAIALGALVFNFVYWSFGFLRMGTTGFTAQASGADDDIEVRATLGRALLLAGGIGLLLVLLQAPTAWIALEFLSASEEIEALTREYFSIRIWGAPASLGTFAVMGTFVGLGRTDQLLRTQIFLNGLNIVLDVILGGVLGLGVSGIAIGTAVSEWATLLLALWLVHGILSENLRAGEPFFDRNRVLDPARVVRTVGVNVDIMVRTLLLLAGFAWFTDQGARLGEEVLAANHILLQLIVLSAYLLDGYANATEILVGRAVGSRDVDAFDRATRSATQLAAVSAIVLGLAVLLIGPLAIAMLTDLPSVREVAGAFLVWASVYVVFSFAAFQLDGIFIGATGTREMRNASVLSLLSFLAASTLLVPRFGNQGLWIAFIIYVVARAASLALWYPQVRARTTSSISTGWRS